MYVPQRTLKNLEAAIHCRMLRAAPVDQGKVIKFWKKVPSLLGFEDAPHFLPIDRQDMLPAYVHHLDSGRRKARYYRAEEEIEASGYGPQDFEFKRAEYFTKTNEKLMKYWDVSKSPFEKDYRPLMKPRGIVLLNPKAVDSIGPVLFKVAKRMKKLFNNKTAPVYRFGERLVRVTYASSLNDKELSEWTTWAHDWVSAGTERYWLILGGDDGLIITHDKEGFLYVCTDFSQFDQSISLGALLYQKRMQKRFGVAQRDLQCQFELGRASIGTALGRLFPGGRFQRLTGEAGTTVGNGMVHHGAFLYAMRHGNLSTLAERYLDLGLSVKLRSSRQLANADFLKGWWVPSGRSSELVWVPLPSQILKMGQHLGDPRTIRGFSKDLWLACRQHACAVAKTYASFGSTPIVEGFVERWKDAFVDVSAWRNDPHKVGAAGVGEVDLDQAYQQAGQRYGIEPSDMKVVADWYRRADVGHFFEHPAFLAMARRDY
jgi:hypothetical protein